MSNLSRYLFLAQSTVGFEHTLIKELKSFNIEAHSLSKKGLNHIQFRATQPEIWQLLFKCRTIDRLKLQLSSSFRARGKKELIKGLYGLPWKAFLPINEHEKYQLPESQSFSSGLYHTTLISNLVKNVLNKLPNKQEFKNEEDEDNDEKEVKKIHWGLVPNAKETPSIYTYLVHDDAYVTMDVVKDSLHKHGYKEAVGWGAIRESIASACLIESGLIEKAKKQQKLRLWDPFCGSGTILLEAFAMFLDLPIREPFEKEFNCKIWPVFDKEGYKSYKKSLFSENKLNIPKDLDIELYGSEISTKEYGKSMINLDSIKLENYKKQNEQRIKIDLSNPIVRSKKYSEIGCLINLDFETAAKLLDWSSPIDIMTNIPYGERSAKYMDDRELFNLYLRFGKVLRKYNKLLGDVYIIAPENSDKILKGFISVSDLNWDRVLSFSNQGLNTALFKLNKSVKKIESEEVPDTDHQEKLI